MNFLGIFGVKTQRIIGQKSQNSARYAGAFWWKKSLFLGGWELRRTPAAYYTSFYYNFPELRVRTYVNPRLGPHKPTITLTNDLCPLNPWIFYSICGRTEILSALLVYFWSWFFVTNRHYNIGQKSQKESKILDKIDPKIWLLNW